MFIGIKELERHPLRFREQFAPGTIDFRTGDFRQAGPLRVDLAAELEGAHIHIAGRLVTRLEFTCARCLESVVREMAPRFDLLYRPLPRGGIGRVEQVGLGRESLEIGFYVRDGVFLADVVAEQVHLALPMKVVCREECRGLCPGCGANRNREKCRCGPRALDPRLAPLARIRAGREDDEKKGS